MKIALDAGHGCGSGARGNGLIEDDMAYDFAERIGHILRKDGFETLMTRPSAKFVSLGARGKKAIENGCGFFLSIHLNAAQSSARGFEAFAAEGDARSLKIASKLLGNICNAEKLKNRGAKWDSASHCRKLKVLRDTYKKMPAVLVELGFLTNKADAALTKDKYFRNRVAKIIAETVEEYIQNSLSTCDKCFAGKGI